MFVVGKGVGADLDHVRIHIAAAIVATGHLLDQNLFLGKKDLFSSLILKLLLGHLIISDQSVPTAMMRKCLNTKS